MEARPTGTVTFMFTDIESSTALWDADADAMSASVELHDRILRREIERWDGAVFATTGDGVAAAFRGAADALEAAASIQHALAGEIWGAGPAPRVRIGLHTGEAHERGGDYFGPPVNRAARVMSVAPSAHIVVSEVTAALLTLPDSIKLVDLGHHRLRGVDGSMRLFGVDHPQAPWTASRARIAGSIEQIPRAGTPLVGRRDEIEATCAALEASRVVTLTGTGGIGKTRIAAEVGRRRGPEFRDGVTFVPLAPVSDRTGSIAALAQALAVRPQSGTSTAQGIVDRLRTSERLIILDNGEHLIESSADLVEQLVAQCPHVSVLVTSREPLRLGGERLVVIEPLARADSVTLFLQRASASGAGWALGSGDDATIAAICDSLDHLPLAIELAAARARVASPAQLLDRLDHRFDLLQSRTRDVNERHQTMWSAITWSYHLLRGDEQRMFDRLSVFAGSFDIAAATAVAGSEPHESEDLLLELVDKSMVNIEHLDVGARYWLFDTLRDYGRARLAERHDDRASRDAHLAHVLERATALDAMLFTPNQLTADDQFDALWAEVDPAIAWAVDCDRFDEAARLLRHTYSHAHARLRTEHADWAALLLRRAPCERHDVRLLAAGASGRWAIVAGDFDRAAQMVEALPSDSWDAATLGGLMCAQVLAQSFGMMGRPADAHRAAARARAIADALPERGYFVESFALLAESFALSATDPEPPRLARLRLAELQLVSGSPRLLSNSVSHLAMAEVFSETPDFAAALSHCRRGVGLASAAGSTFDEAQCLALAAVFAVVTHDTNAVDDCIVALSHAAETGQKAFHTAALAAGANLCANAGDTRSAARAVGYLRASSTADASPVFRAPWNGELKAVYRDPAMAADRATGAAMTDIEILAAIASALRSIPTTAI